MELLRRFRWGITLGLVVVAVLVGLLLWKPAPPVAPPPVAAIVVFTPTALPTEVPLPTVTPAPLVVYVSGAVLHPGVYALPPGARVADALAAAGGATDQADLVQVNLARRVRDEEQIHIPRQGEPTRTAPPPQEAAAAPSATAGKVNINTAGVAELDSLPGIGPGYAARIIAYRESHGSFRSIEEIQNVPGIGPSIFARISDLITVQ